MIKKSGILLTLLILLVCFSACARPTGIPNTPSPAGSETPFQQEITVYFTDENRFLAATEPYEVPVTRTVQAGADLPRAVLDVFFAGPTAVEKTQGLKLVASGFTHVRHLEIENSVARVYLGGACNNNGAAYSVANLISKNLSQFPEIIAIKIFDENDSNLDPDSPYSSLPYCLEP